MQSGNAIFTYPTGTSFHCISGSAQNQLPCELSIAAGPVKCGGAGQKIAYLADHYWRKQGVRDSIDIQYNTALPRVFGAVQGL